MNAESRPWEQLRDLEPPLGARRRVLAETERAIARPQASRLVRIAIPVAALGVLALLLEPQQRSNTKGTGSTREVAAGTAAPTLPATSKTDSERPPATTPRPTPAQPQVTPLRTGAAADQTSPVIRVPARERIAVDMKRARVTIVGPAAVKVASHKLVVDSGMVRVSGDTLVSSPSCEARVRGRARVSVTAGATQVRVFAGSAEIASSTGACTIVRQPVRLAPSARPAEKPAPTTPAPAATATDGHQPPTADAPAASAQPSALRRQVEGFRRIRAMDDTTASLAAWRQWLIRWPNSPLRSEAKREIGRLEAALGTKGAPTP